MNNKLFGTLAVAGALLLTSSAQAQDRFSAKGQMAFSADRLFGFYGYSASTSYDVPNVGEYEFKQGGSEFSLLWGPSSVPGIFAVNPYATPRLSFDYFVIDGLSVGGSIAYAKAGGEYKQEKGPPNTVLAPSSDTPEVRMFAFSPRVGYAYMFSDIIGIWPRGGFTYAQLTTEEQVGDREEETSKVFSLDIEAMLVIVPKQHFAFVVGPVIDFGLTGSSKHKETPMPAVNRPDWDRDAKLHTYGIAAGMLGYF